MEEKKNGDKMKGRDKGKAKEWGSRKRKDEWRERRTAWGT